MTFKVIALIASYNEARFISSCISHLATQGIDVYLIDNQSIDATVDIAKTFKNVVGIESFPRGEDNTYNWKLLLQRKEELANTLDACWFMHVDVDERHLPPKANTTLVEELHRIDQLGFSATQSYEFSFVPTLESPDHDHPDFEKTMRWYYFFAPRPDHLMRMWKKQNIRVDISSAAGHRVVFPEVKLYPEHFFMKHYLFLSKEHAFRKYVQRAYNKEELREGWHRWRSELVSNAIELPSEKQLESIDNIEKFSISNPWKKHYLNANLDNYKNYYIKEGYAHRTKSDSFSYQEVKKKETICKTNIYPLVVKIGKRHNLSSIIDIGCNLACKSKNLSPNFDLIGIGDSVRTTSCNRGHGSRKWIEHDLEKGLPFIDEIIVERSIILCSEIIEKLFDPHPLLNDLAILMEKAQVAIITTPERDLVSGINEMGPPKNVLNVREWNSSEFQKLLRMHNLNIGYVGLRRNPFHFRKQLLVVFVNQIGLTFNWNNIIEFSTVH
jgi:glycosyltransferase involved in cell wall biosynthesis